MCPGAFGVGAHFTKTSDAPMVKTTLFCFLVSSFLFTFSGCSHTLHERKKDESNPKDEGSKTEVQLRGPRAVIMHSF
jgi:hypothetical protein